LLTFDSVVAREICSVCFCRSDADPPGQLFGYVKVSVTYVECCKDPFAQSQHLVHDADHNLTSLRARVLSLPDFVLDKFELTRTELREFFSFPFSFLSLWFLDRYVRCPGPSLSGEHVPLCALVS